MRPRIGILLGDPSGIGPEMAAKLLADPEVHARADVLVIGDRRVLREGERVAGQKVPGEMPFHDLGNVDPATIPVGRVSPEAGRAVYQTLKRALALAQDGAIDGFCFAPLNKAALKAGGAPFGDEHTIFAHEIGFTGPYCEHNVLEGLWTTRVSSHVPFIEVPKFITRERIRVMTKLAHDTLRGAGFDKPRVAVCALNPHGGDNGLFGREEIDVIAPAVADARALGVDAAGPFPADTIFVRARAGDYDAVVTMYHDQGQIAMKLLGFNRGVTVTGGLPIPVTTPASGTAFDIVGKGVAKVDGLKQAFLLVSRMCEIRASARGS